jgi:hypothetical protein
MHGTHNVKYIYLLLAKSVQYQNSQRCNILAENLKNLYR